jgi:hypothetical protein
MHRQNFRPLNRDKLHMLSRDHVAPIAFEALHPIQDYTQEEMVAGVALLFATICERVRLDPEELHRIGARMLKDQPAHLKTNAAVQSLRDFAGIKIAGEDRVVVS